MSRLGRLAGALLLSGAFFYLLRQEPAAPRARSVSLRRIERPQPPLSPGEARLQALRQEEQALLRVKQPDAAQAARLQALARQIALHRQISDREARLMALPPGTDAAPLREELQQLYPQAEPARE
jgi:hypothetical protein